jgi:GNAT superfamily N-acetyltransferase
MMRFLDLHSPTDRYFSDAIGIYREAFESTPEIYLDPKYFSQSTGRVTRDMQWHFCVLVDERAIGMAAFASTIHGGYGGYVAVRNDLRNHGYGTLILKNIMDTVLKDSKQKGWDIKFLFAEYEDRNRRLWESKGFHTLSVKYFQPPLTDKNEWVPMNLGAIPIVGADTITGKEVLDFVTFLYSRIYYQRGFARQETYRSLKIACENLRLVLE